MARASLLKLGVSTIIFRMNIYPTRRLIPGGLEELAPVITIEGSIEYSDTPENFLAHIRVSFLDAELRYTPITVSQTSFKYEQMRAIGESEATVISRSIEEYFEQVTGETK